MRKLLALLTALLLVAALTFFLLVPRIVGRSMNGVVSPPPYRSSEQARKLHESLVIVDLHDDSLLWDRDLLERGSWGHVDIPRLIEGNVALQAFTIVTKTPRGMNIEKNDASSDNITLLAVAERWPASSWKSLTERALHQARRLHAAALSSQGKLIVIKTSSDLERYLNERSSGVTAGFLGIEGSHALEGKLENLDRLFDAGVRMIGMTHFFDNEAGGSAHGVTKGG